MKVYIVYDAPCRIGSEGFTHESVFSTMDKARSHLSRIAAEYVVEGQRIHTVSPLLSYAQYRNEGGKYEDEYMIYVAEYEVDEFDKQHRSYYEYD